MKTIRNNNTIIRPAFLYFAICVVPMQAYAAQNVPISVNVANLPLLVQTRGNATIAPTMLHSMSQKAGVPLQITKKVGNGAYLVRPTKAVTSQGIRTIASRLASHPNILSAHPYQQTAPAYVITPANHKVTLNGARLSGSTLPLTSYHWQQIAGPQTATSGTANPSMTFLARQDASPASTVSDPAAVSPGDLSAPPQTFDCAISAASIRKKGLSVPMLISKQSFMCNPFGSSTPTTGSPTNSGAPGVGLPPANSGTPSDGTPTDNSGNPVTSTPTDNSGNPVTSTPTDNSGNPIDGTPTDNSGNPIGGTPTDNSGNPLGSTPSNNGGFPLSGTPSDNSGLPSSSSPGGSGCNATANSIGLGISNAVANGGGTANSTGIGIGNARATCGQGGNPVANSIGIGLSNSIAGMSVKKTAVSTRALPSSLLGFRLIATDKAGISHVRNIYVRVYGAAANPVTKAVPKVSSQSTLFNKKR